MDDHTIHPLNNIAVLEEFGYWECCRLSCWCMRCNIQLASAFLWGDLDQDQWSKITQIMVHQRNQWILEQNGLFGSFEFDVPWSEWSWITDPDPDHFKGTHPKGQFTWKEDDPSAGIILAGSFGLHAKTRLLGSSFHLVYMRDRPTSFVFGWLH